MTELEVTNPDIPADRDPLAAWDRWWSEVGGTPGEIVWDADPGDLEADLEHFAASFGQRLLVVDFGCGDGRQTRFLGRHFAAVCASTYVACRRRPGPATGHGPDHAGHTPGEISEADLVRLFPADCLEVMSTGTSRIHTVNTLPDGQVIKVPAIYALIRPRQTRCAGTRSDKTHQEATDGNRDHLS